ncbi:MAG TPA: M28 family peptidase [Vicinamibacterales bacterium]|nr:M28 family peptidase [Vicinamibacterales bacterium]
MLLPFTLVLAGFGAAAQQTVLPERVRAVADSITADSLARDVEYLASDELQGRNTPSPGLDLAARYVVDRLQAARLRPLGDAGSYLQHYEVRETRLDTAKSAVTIGERTFAFGRDFALRSLAQGIGGSLPLVYVGHGWTVPSKGIDPYAGLDVRGKLVVAHAPTAMPRDAGVSQIGRIAVGGDTVFTEAARRGAAGVVFLTFDGRTSLADLAEQNVTRLELEPAVPSAYAAPPITSLLLSRDAVESLLAGEKIEAAELIRRGEAGDYPASFELTKRIAVELPVAAVATHRPANVVALLEGSDPVLKHEYITVASHLDGAVGTRAVNGDHIYNSADDNATGSAANLHIAERLAAVKPRRSVIFIWDSGEERGLWGTRRFVGSPPVPLEQIVAHVNIDMIGATRAPGSPDAGHETVTGPNEVLLIGPGVLSDRVDALLQRVNRAYLDMRFNREYDRADREFFYPRTDAGPFLERGILTIGYFTGIHPRYHQPSDEAKYLDPRKMEAVTRTVFAAIWALAETDERPRIDKEIPATVPRYRQVHR